MSIRTHFSLLFFALVFTFASAQTFSQTAPLEGKLILKQDSGNKPAAGVLVEIFRADINGKYLNATTDKQGYFTFAGIAVGSVYYLNVSGPGISPTVIPNIRPGSKYPDFFVVPGDGRKYSEEESRVVLKRMRTSDAGAEESPEVKKQREEEEKKRKEVEEKNKKIEETNEIVNRALEEGVKAFQAKSYTVAIEKFQEGINADPTYYGTAPVLLNNKAKSLLNRGLALFNEAVELINKGDKANAEVKKAEARRDLEDSIASADAALEIIKNASPPDETVRRNLDGNRTDAITIRKNVYRRLAQTSLDTTKGKEAAAAFAAYMEIEKDAAEKAKAQVELAQTLQSSNEFELAFQEFKKINEVNPTDPDALVGMGLTLTNIGYITMESDEAKGKAQLQEAVNYLQQYVDIAPEGHKFKNDARDAIVSLKEIVTPQKTKPAQPARRRN